MGWKSKKMKGLFLKKNKNKPEKKYNINEFSTPKGLFSDFMKDIVVKNKRIRRVNKLNLLKSPAINQSVLKDKIDNIANLSDKEIKELVKSSYGDILLYLDGKQIDNTFSKFFKFLSEYSKEVHFNFNLYGVMNSIAYNVIMYQDISEDISKSILDITDKINTNTTCHLYADTGLDMDICNLISIAKLSTDGIESVDRVNKILCLIGDIFSRQNIIDIYESLFENISEVYCSTTTLSISASDYKIKSSEVIYKEVDAVVFILNQLPDMYIDKVVDFCNYSGYPPNKQILQILREETKDNYRVRRRFL